MHLFVYGTLMRKYVDPRTGEMRVHQRSSCLRHVKHIQAKLRGYKLVWPEELDFPFIVESKDSCVFGELYFDVDEKTVELIDQIEDVKGGLFLKRNVTVETDRGTFDAIAYVGGEALRTLPGRTFKSLLPDFWK